MSCNCSIYACRLARLLQQEEEWKQESIRLDEQALPILCSVAEMYRGQGDKLSATVLAEATCTALDRLTPAHEPLQLLAETASIMFEELTPQEMDMVRMIPAR